LEKAKEMADRLVPAFNTTTGIPYGIVNLKTQKARNPSWSQGSSILSEFGSVQLEYKYLSKHLGDPSYAKLADKVMEYLYSMDKTEGMYPVYLNPETGKFTSNLVSYGGLGDSFYEYLLKQYILSGKEDLRAKEMYEESIEGLVNRLLGKSIPNKWQFIGEYQLGQGMIPEMDHLVCYVPGMLALGAEGPFEKSHLKLATALLDTCYKLYESQVTGIGPERVRFNVDGETKEDYKILKASYLLRPETIESIFVLWRKTHNETYREWGWKIFEAIEKYCKTPTSYSGLEDVTKKKPTWNNSMQSFFFAETLKYLFLLFSDDNVLPLDSFVFTTEAHPLGIFVDKHQPKVH
jgi:mannosyl-oligosaccharide alpha-1,2-mannosidase